VKFSGCVGVQVANMPFTQIRVGLQILAWRGTIDFLIVYTSISVAMDDSESTLGHYM